MNSPRSAPLIGFTWDDVALKVFETTETVPGIAVDSVPMFDLQQVEADPRLVSTTSDSKDLTVVTWKHSHANGKTSVQRVGENVYEFSLYATVTSAIQPKSIGWGVTSTMRSPRWLNHQYRLTPVNRGTHIVDAWTPLLVKGQTLNGPEFVELVGSRFYPGVSLSGADTSHSTNLQLTIWLDHHHTHPRFSFSGEQFWNWHNHYTFQPGNELAARFRVILDSVDRPAVVSGRYPGRKKALISITDHADHDSCHKVSALFFGSSIPTEQETQKQGFAGLQLPFTKTVFTTTDSPDGAGLHNPDYVAICDRAYAAGIEIGPHGIHETVEPPLSQFAGLIEPFKSYSPRTWIDHGRSFHCNYRLSGWNPDHPYNLDQVLAPLGIHCIWAGFDFGLAVPNRSLNQLTMQNFSGSRYIRDLPRSAWRAIRGGRPWAIAHEIATIVFQMMPDRAMKQYFEMHRHMERFVWGRKLASLPPAFREMIQLALLVAKPSNFREVIRQFFGPRAELEMAPVMYLEHETLADPIRQRWLFNTIAVHDVEDAYSPIAVQQLQDEYGFHIAHTYLTSMSRAHLSHALQRHPTAQDHWQLSPAFAANLENMAQEQAAGNLWIASIGEVCEFWQKLRQVEVLPEGGGRWTIKSPTTLSLDGVPVVIVGEHIPTSIPHSAPFHSNAILATANPGTFALPDNRTAR